MKKLARAIVKMRRLILIAAVLLLIPAAVGAIATPISYDILSYLPQELDSRVGQLLLETDYHLASTNMITVEGMPTNELLAMKAEIDEVPDVLNTFWLSDVLDPAVPTEMLPADVQQFILVGGVDAVHVDFAAGGQQDGVQVLGQGGLAGAVVPQHSHEGALLDVQAYPVQHKGVDRPLLRIGEAEPLCLNDCMVHIAHHSLFGGPAARSPAGEGQAGGGDGQAQLLALGAAAVPAGYQSLQQVGQYRGG